MSVSLSLAEFEAIVTASFDKIGSHLVALDNLSDNTTRTTTTQHQVISSTDKIPRRTPSAFSFLRRVKSHAASLLFSTTTGTRQVPPLPPRPATPAPFPAPSPDVSHSFFDDDDIDHVDGRVLSRSRSRTIAAPPARPNSRLSSAFGVAPVLFRFPSSSLSTPCSLVEQHDILRPDSRAGLARPCKPSLGHKLHTKLSFPKLPQHSNISSPLIDSPPVTPSHSSHSYPASFSGCGYAHPYSAYHEERSITPEEDPFRKDEIAQTPLATPRLPSSSPRSTSFYDDSEAYRHVPASCSVPALSSRWSSDSESLPSPNHARVGRPDRPVLRASPFQGPSTSLTFPLPPSTQKSFPLPGVTVRVATPTPGPPPAYPPPPTPPPFGPLPCLPPAGTTTASRVRPSARLPKESSRRRSRKDSASKSTSNGQVRRRRSHLRVDMSSPSFASRPKPAKSHVEEHLSSSAPWNHEKPITRRRERPSSPFPLPLLPMRARRDPTGRLEALKATTHFADPWKNPIIRQFDENADTISDSEVEPDRDFDQSDKARKKISVSSAASGHSALSSISTTSTYTTSSSASMVTTLTAATTSSPSTSPHMSPDNPNNISQMLVTDDIVSPSSWQAEASPSSTKSPARYAGIYIKRGGTLAAHEPQGDLFLVDGEEAIIGASGWAEFRSYCNARGDVFFRLAGSLYGNGIADVLIIEFQRDGKTCGVELLLIPRNPSADFPGRIPGSYPLPSPDLPLLLRSVPRTFPVEIPQIAWNGSVLGLEDIAPLCDASRVTPLGRSLRELNHLDCTQDSGVQRSAALTFVVSLPINLRDLAKRAREMDLLDGVVTPQENSSHF